MNIQINSCTTSDQQIVQLVQGDTNPPLIISLTNETYNSLSGNTTITPIDVSSATVELKIRKLNSTVFATVTGTPIAGYTNTDGTIDYTSPYDILGKGGRISFFWEPGDLTEFGKCQGEVQITYLDSGIQTVYNIIPIQIREQF